MQVVAEGKSSAQVNVASNLSAQTIDVVVPTEIGGQSNTKVGMIEHALNLKQICGWKLCEKIQLRSWSKMPSKLLSGIGFLYKVVQKIGLFLSVRFLNLFFPFKASL